MSIFKFSIGGLLLASGFCTVLLCSMLAANSVCWLECHKSHQPKQECPASGSCWVFSCIWRASVFLLIEFYWPQFDKGGWGGQRRSFCLGNTLIAVLCSPYLWSLYLTYLLFIFSPCSKGEIMHYRSTSANDESIEYRLPAKGFLGFLCIQSVAGSENPQLSNPFFFLLFPSPLVFFRCAPHKRLHRSILFKTWKKSYFISWLCALKAFWLGRIEQLINIDSCTKAELLCLPQGSHCSRECEMTMCLPFIPPPCWTIVLLLVSLLALNSDYN